MIYFVISLMYINSLFANECEQIQNLSEVQKISKVKLVKEEVCINLYLGENQKLDLSELSNKANSCINKAMKNSPIKIELKLNCSKLESLNNWEKNTKFGLYDPLLTSSAKNVPFNELGYKTRNYSFFISNKVKRSNAKSFWPDTIPTQEKLDAIKAGEIDRKCKVFFEKELNPFQTKMYTELGLSKEDYKAKQISLSNEYSKICEEGYKLQDKYPNRSLPSGSCAHIRPESNIDELSKTLVHELMHLYAGLADRYKGKAGEREKWANNLMGLNSPCNPLTDHQVKALIEYRLTGAEEKSF